MTDRPLFVALRLVGDVIPSMNASEGDNCTAGRLDPTRVGVLTRVYLWDSTPQWSCPQLPCGTA